MCLENGKTLWVTSFNVDLFNASGIDFLTSFRKYVYNKYNDLFIGHEGFESVTSIDNGQFNFYNLDKDELLAEWLDRFNYIIPKSLGGKADICKCPNPWAKSEKEHLNKNCYHSWFNRNASRWFRKIICLKEAIKLGYNHIIWLDADCIFKEFIPVGFINKLFYNGEANERDILYLKGPRPVAETGFVGFLTGCCHHRGTQAIETLIDYYMSGKFLAHYRWDDSMAIQTSCLKSGLFRTRDLGTVTSGDHNDIFPKSLIGKYITHNKGRHGRILGIMK